VDGEQPHWAALEKLIEREENDPGFSMDIKQVNDFHYLYQRASAALAEVTTFSAEPQLRAHLESLVARAYGVIHARSRRGARFKFLVWFFQTLPRTFRQNIRYFWLAVAATAAGAAVGAALLVLDPDAKDALLPFPHLKQTPAERVAREEGATKDRLHEKKASFSSLLMTHNTRVAVFTLGLGMTYGLGTLVALFHNGVILGAVGLDYVRGGETEFLLGWLLPHGVIEIPAIMIAGQGGLLLGNALIGWGRRVSLRQRLRNVAPELVTLISGAALLLVWAGLVEAFLSQYHKPVVPYGLKIAFGLLELGLLCAFLIFSGAKGETERETA
jgi:uncharacterized membrane protein SpoIIM required for sporulation